MFMLFLCAKFSAKILACYFGSLVSTSYTVRFHQVAR